MEDLRAALEQLEEIAGDLPTELKQQPVNETSMVYDAVSRGLLSDFHSIALLSRKGAAVCLAKSGCDLSGGYRHCLRRWRHFRGDLDHPAKLPLGQDHVKGRRSVYRELLTERSAYGQSVTIRPFGTHCFCHLQAPDCPEVDFTTLLHLCWPLG